MGLYIQAGPTTESSGAASSCTDGSVFSCVEGVDGGVLVIGVSVDAGAGDCCSGSVVISVSDKRPRERSIACCIDVDVDQILERGD